MTWHVVRAIVTLLVLDVLWVKFVMLSQYEVLVKNVQSGRDMAPRVAPAVLAYALMLAGLYAFVLRTPHAIARGAAFGAIVYGVYNCTAMAVFDNWNTSLAVRDVAWGAFVYAVSAAAAHPPWSDQAK